MTARSSRSDRVESFISAIDAYEPTLDEIAPDTFRVFSRFISRSIDGRYLERHPPDELLPDMEKLMRTGLERPKGQINIRIEPGDAQDRRGVLHTNMLDQLFLYSTVRLALDFLGIKNYRAINSVIPISRDETGHLTTIGQANASRESFVWMEIEYDGLEAKRGEIESTLRDRLKLLQSAVDDFYEMRACIDRVADRFHSLGSSEHENALAFKDGARFLKWLLDERFVLLGCRYLPVSAQDEAPFRDLGTGRSGDWSALEREAKERSEKGAYRHPPFLSVRKSSNPAWVYRPGRTDLILVDHQDGTGNPLGLLVIEGLFSFQASAMPRTDIPLLDRVIDDLYTEMQATKGTHRYRTIRNAFNSLPLEYLFSLKHDDVREIVNRVLEADSERRLQIHISSDTERNSAFVFVALPRTHYNDELRSDIKRLLKTAFRASAVDDGVYAGDVDSVTFHYFLTGATLLSEAEESAVKREIDTVASPWRDRLYEELAERHEVGNARKLHTSYSEAFGARYREETSVRRTVDDIELLEGLGTTSAFDCDVYRERADEPLNVTRLRLYETQRILLSDILPILDNFGLIVIDQFTTRVHVPGRSEQMISTFRLGGVDGMTVDLMSRRRRLREAVRAVVTGAMADEELNRLLLRADVPWTYVVLMRAYTYYARQIGIQYGLVTIRDVLLRNGDVVRALTEYFRAKFDPGYSESSSTVVDDERRALIERARQSLDTLLQGVSELVSDQVLRYIMNLIDATVRTNFYSRTDSDNHVVLKFNPQLINRMPDPRPYREIYVHHPRVDGLHLRGGSIARGGIRWSDRPLDYRTEVLSLMATQNLKNVLIVPTGGKGAFILKNPPSDLSERREMADEMYKVFIGGVLDVTDDIVDGETVTPARVVRYEDPDPYLVVAADKGTAHLSDTANEVAESRNFWLGDAFASGGSTGYDHKKEGITAKGAWECVKRHFREMGMDPESDPITVAGIGDMSGDVFGNGMLLSKSIRLVGAFDHRHVFIDPDPDPAVSFAARQELFEKGRSSWEDYPSEAISAGGGVYSRKAKAIRLSERARELLGLPDEPISGQDLIKTVMRLPVDLLWNGGIGTYIKSAEETHFEAGDPANDLVRIDASEARCRVIGEGGNLGISQRGRVDLATQGIRLNTDAVDNSAGVDLSDHEVNLKILFQQPMRRGEMSHGDRNEWMLRLKDEACAMVLNNNWLQCRMISIDEIRSRRDPARFARAVNLLMDQLGLRRRDMSFPGERILAERQAEGKGFMRPELAILASLAKQRFRHEMERADALDDKALEKYLRSYFPTRVLEEFEEDVRNHPLALRIGRTVLLNKILTDAGATWLTETTLRTGGKTEALVSAYFDGCALLDADSLKAGINELAPKLDTNTEYSLRLRVEEAIEKTTDWLLRRSRRPGPDFGEKLSYALNRVEDLIRDENRAVLDQEAQDLVANDVGEEFAQRVVKLRGVDRAIDLALVAHLGTTTVETAASVHRIIGASTGLLDLVSRRYLIDDPALDEPASFALRDRIRRHLVDMAVAVLETTGGSPELGNETRQFLDGLRGELTPLQVSGAPDIGNLAIAADRVERAVNALKEQLHAG